MGNCKTAKKGLTGRRESPYSIVVGSIHRVRRRRLGELSHPLTFSSILDEEQNNPLSRYAQSRRPTMTRASVHVPHLLCPDNCNYLQGIANDGDAKSTLKGNHNCGFEKKFWFQ